MAGFNRFGSKWASGGAIAAPSQTQYAQGFSFLGTQKPTVELFNAMFQERDEQINWLYAQVSRIIRDGGITPAETPDNQLEQAMYALWGGAGGFGYQKLPGGLIMQWGAGSGIPSTTPGNGVYEAPVNVSFPIAFPQVCLNIQITANNIIIGGGVGGVSGGQGVQELAFINSATSTGFVAGISSLVSGVVMQFNWLALGR